MQGWQTSYLGLRGMPGEISKLELQAFFSFSRAELELIALRRGDSLKLGLYARGRTLFDHQHQARE